MPEEPLPREPYEPKKHWTQEWDDYWDRVLKNHWPLIWALIGFLFCVGCFHETLLARFGGDVLMPDVRHLIHSFTASAQLAGQLSQVSVSSVHSCT